MDDSTLELLKKEFLHCYHEQMGNKLAACKILSLEPKKVSSWIKNDKIFAEAIAQVEDDITSAVEELSSHQNDDEDVLVDFSAARNSSGYVSVPQTATIAKMNSFLRVFPQVGWNVRAAAETLGIPHSRISAWRRKYPDFAEAMQRCSEEAIDYAESRLFELMNQDDIVGAKTTIFFLETVGKTRGYTRSGRDGNHVPEDLRSKEIRDAMVRAARLSLAAPPIAVQNNTDCTEDKEVIDVPEQ